MRLDAFAAAAKGKATRIIIPSQSQSFAGFAASFKEISASVMKPDSTRKYGYSPLCRIQAQEKKAQETGGTNNAAYYADPIQQDEF